MKYLDDKIYVNCKGEECEMAEACPIMNHPTYIKKGISVKKYQNDVCPFLVREEYESVITLALQSIEKEEKSNLLEDELSNSPTLRYIVKAELGNNIYTKEEENDIRQKLLDKYEDRNDDDKLIKEFKLLKVSSFPQVLLRQAAMDKVLLWSNWCNNPKSRASFYNKSMSTYIKNSEITNQATNLGGGNTTTIKNINATAIKSDGKAGSNPRLGRGIFSNTAFDNSTTKVIEQK